MTISDDEEKKDSTELTYLEARPFLVDVQDEEKGEYDPTTSNTLASMHKTANQGLSKRFWIAAGVNSLSTVGIVFTNKLLFTNPSLRHIQVLFAAFHFTLTYLFLHLASTPHLPFRLFTPKPFPFLTILPLALAMIGNVVLMNASLAYSSIQFYQIVRVLLTPCVALLNLLLYGLTIPMRAAGMLVPVCVGVAVVSYFDALSTTAQVKETSPLGVFFAFSALGASAIHTVWIGKYHRSLQCSSMQLLMNQAPVSVALMVYIIPLADDVSGFVHGVGWREGGLIFVSGGLACLINLSQFLIINEAGPVSSTVVGHFKTCSIIAMGWIVSGKQLRDGSLVGVVLAVGGIISYSYVTQREARK
ncbi:hypothetical protein M409DRAFT_27682 [Zasmidium cellare ATCC 36951]|uniref:GDP-mannose transporter n=1 Tax=Zasmidium cellare ATCC 36951 TaxID=1080233 RepID=A0A6A6C941_ZASCE|nr:uncharacterized protein M409DRAFT_27682 [Zasmidium cellare ATCC 36951]KAF2161956.1 hypothetical protein M409DRAFT_27682 [Zasmidium cellare ATCC 36951]